MSLLACEMSLLACESCGDYHTCDNMILSKYSFRCRKCSTKFIDYDLKKIAFYEYQNYIQYDSKKIAMSKVN